MANENNGNKVRYTAYRSLAGTCGGRLFLCFLFCWLIVPAIYGIYLAIENSCYCIEFYDDKIVTRSGVISTSEKRSVLMPIMGVSVEYTFWGKIWGYGNVHVDTVGTWDINTQAIKDPEEFRAYLESLMNKQAAAGFAARPVVAN